jgi:hypothetical protein
MASLTTTVSPGICRAYTPRCLKPKSSSYSNCNSLKRYDFDGDNKVTPEDVQLLLSHIPFNWASLKGGNENSKPDDEILQEQETELNQLTNAIFKNGEPLSFEEFKQVCEKNTSEIFLAVNILCSLTF